MELREAVTSSPRSSGSHGPSTPSPPSTRSSTPTASPAPAPQAATTDTDRYAHGRGIQAPLYGTEIADELADEPLAG